MTLRFLLVLWSVCLLMGCGQPSGDRILGHWRAERLQLQGLGADGAGIRGGPERVALNGRGYPHPHSSITVSGDAVTLDMPLGLGLRFQFDGADRIAFDMPLMGKVYYRRVSGSAQAERPVPLSPAASR